MAECLQPNLCFLLLYVTVLCRPGHLGVEELCRGIWTGVGILEMFASHPKGFFSFTFKPFFPEITSFRKWFDIKTLKVWTGNRLPCCLSAWEPGLLQPPEALQDRHQWLPPGQVGERAYKGPLWDARVPGWVCRRGLMLRRRWCFKVNFLCWLCSSRGGWQTTIRPASGLLGHRRHHVHIVSGWPLRRQLSTAGF